MKWNLGDENMHPVPVLLSFMFIIFGVAFLVARDEALLTRQWNLWVWLVSIWLWATYLAAINLPIRRAVKGETA